MAELVTVDGWPEPDSLGVELQGRLPDEYFVVDSPTVRGQSAEVIVVGPQGLFVVQQKDWTGEIRPIQGGDWQVVLDEQQAGRYPNPGREAQKVEKALQAFLKDEFPDLQQPKIFHLLVLRNPDARLVPAPDVEPIAVTPQTMSVVIAGTPTPATGDLPEEATREELALALAQRRFTATQRASKPFVFRSGGLLSSGKTVWTLQEAVQHMDRHPNDGIYHLGNDTLAQWLESEGAAHLAHLARQVMRQRETDQRVALEQFLIGTGLVKRPTIRVRPQPVNLGCIIAGESCLSRVRLRKGRGRGYLFGTLHTNQPWLRVEPHEFRGDEVQVAITADTEALPISAEPWQADLVIESSASAEPVTVPVRVHVRGEPPGFSRYLVRPLVAAVVAGLPGGVIGWSLGRSGMWVPGFLSELPTPPLSAEVVWAAFVGLVWALLGLWRGLQQRPAWPILYAAGRWLLRTTAWLVALALAAGLGYVLWTTLVGPIRASGLTFVLGAMTLAAIPSTIGEIRTANLVCDVPISTDRRFLVRPVLGAIVAVGLMLVLVAIVNVAGPTYQQLEEQGTVEETQTWIATRWEELDATISDFVDELYLRRYDRRAPPGGGATPTVVPSPESQVEP